MKIGVNRGILSGFGFIFVLLFSGCGGPKYVDVKDSSDYSTMGLDYHDIAKAADDSVKSLLLSSYVKELSKLKAPKVLAISNIVNDTVQTFDVEQLSRKVVRDMRNSGKFVLTVAISGSGGSRDVILDKAREARDNDEFDQYTVVEKGELKAPELSLSGKIVQRNSKVSSSKQRSDYYFLLTLTDVKSGLVVWDDEVNIIKVGSNSSVTW